MRWVLLHLIEEIARHGGRADIIRESIDGATYPLHAAAERWPDPWFQPWEPAHPGVLRPTRRFASGETPEVSPGTSRRPRGRFPGSSRRREHTAGPRPAAREVAAGLLPGTNGARQETRFFQYGPARRRGQGGLPSG